MKSSLPQVDHNGTKRYPFYGGTSIVTVKDGKFARTPAAAARVEDNLRVKQKKLDKSRKTVKSAGNLSHSLKDQLRGENVLLREREVVFSRRASSMAQLDEKLRRSRHISEHVPESIIPVETWQPVQEAMMDFVWPMGNHFGGSSHGLSTMNHLDTEWLIRWINFMERQVELSVQSNADDKLDDIKQVQYIAFHEACRQVMNSNYARGEFMLNLWHQHMELTQSEKELLECKLAMSKDRIAELERKFIEQALQLSNRRNSANSHQQDGNSESRLSLMERRRVSQRKRVQSIRRESNIRRVSMLNTGIQMKVEMESSSNKHSTTSQESSQAVPTIRLALERSGSVKKRVSVFSPDTRRRVTQSQTTRKESNSTNRQSSGNASIYHRFLQDLQQEVLENAKKSFENDANGDDSDDSDDDLSFFSVSKNQIQINGDDASTNDVEHEILRNKLLQEDLDTALERVDGLEVQVEEMQSIIENLQKANNELQAKVNAQQPKPNRESSTQTDCCGTADSFAFSQQESKYGNDKHEGHVEEEEKMFASAPGISPNQQGIKLGGGKRTQAHVSIGLVSHLQQQHGKSNALIGMDNCKLRAADRLPPVEVKKFLCFSKLIPIQSVKWVRKQIWSMYEELIVSGNMDALGTSHAQFVSDYFVLKYGLPNVAMRHIQIFIQNVFHHQLNPAVILFYRFLDGRLSLSVRNFYLRAMELCRCGQDSAFLKTFEAAKTNSVELSKKPLKKATIFRKQLFENSTEKNCKFPEDEEGNPNWISVERLEEVVMQLYPSLPKSVMERIIHRSSAFETVGMLPEWSTTPMHLQNLLSKTPRVERDLFLYIFIDEVSKVQLVQKKGFEKWFTGAVETGSNTMSYAQFTSFMRSIQPESSTQQIRDMFGFGLQHQSNADFVTSEAICFDAFAAVCGKHGFAELLE